MKALNILEARRAQAAVDRRLFYLPDDDYAKNKDQIDQLEAEQQDLYSRNNIDLPEFMRNAPPVFNATKNDSIRVVMMGDFGTRGEDQHKVAAAMVQEIRRNHSISESRWVTTSTSISRASTIPIELRF